MSEPAPRGPAVWIQSPWIDLPFLILSPLAGLAAIAASLTTGQRWIGIGVAYLVGFPHYLSTLTFYMGDDNREHFRSRWIAFFAGPLAILAAVLSMRLAGLQMELLALIFVWNIFHVARQSSGIQSIYRRLNGGPDAERGITQGAILFTSAAMAAWNIEAFPPLRPALSALGPGAPGLLRAALIAAASFYLARLLHSLLRRDRSVSTPEILFLSTSLLLFHPFLWLDDLELATLGMLTGHFLQYLAVVWVIHGRKYGSLRGSITQRLLGRLGRQPAFLAAVMLLAGALIYAFTRVTISLGADTARLVLFNALVLNHFYLDGLIWAFRTPYVRRSLGPYLVPAAQDAVR